MSAVDTVRRGLGAMFVGSGLMKYAIPRLRDAWRRQLRSANIPAQGPAFWTVPVAETAAGGLLIANVMPRAAAGAVVGLMAGAVYVHLVVDDPSLFPLQPKAPVVPMAVAAAAGYVIARGGPTTTPGA